MIDWLYEKTGVMKSYGREDREYNVTDLFICRKKKMFRDAGYKQVITVDNALRGRVIGQLVHKGMSVLLEEDGWDTGMRLEKKVGDYLIIGKPDAVKDGVVLEIKFQRYFKEVGDVHILQTGVYLNMLGLKRGIILYVAPNAFEEVYIDREVSDDDILWFIEHPVSPFSKWECEYCGYRVYCNTPL